MTGRDINRLYRDGGGLFLLVRGTITNSERRSRPSHCIIAVAHAANTLQAPSPGGPAFKFIEPAYDLAICMRGWGAPLLAGDALALGQERARLLSALTGVEPGPIWEWGFIERVSTGLLLKQLGQGAEAAEYLAVAELWAAGDDGAG